MLTNICTCNIPHHEVMLNLLDSLARGPSLSKYLLPRVPSLSKYLLPRGPSLSKYCHNVESTEGIVSLLDGAGAHVKVLVPGNVLQLLEVLVNGWDQRFPGWTALSTLDLIVHGEWRIKTVTIIKLNLIYLSGQEFVLQWMLCKKKPFVGDPWVQEK